MKKILIPVLVTFIFYLMACSDNKTDNTNDPGSNPGNGEGNQTFPQPLPDNLSDKWGKGETDVWDGTIDTSWYNKDLETYNLTSAEQLAGLAKLSNSGISFRLKTIKLCVNVILNKEIKLNAEEEIINEDSLLEWPIIGRTNCFRGSFDGDYHIISGLYSNYKGTSNYASAGLFGYVDGNRSDKSSIYIKNIGIINSYVKGRFNTGAIASCIDTGGRDSIIGPRIIENCFNTGRVISIDYVGGILGLDPSYGRKCHIQHCFNSGIIKGESSFGASSVGEISGHGGMITDCYNTGQIIATKACCGISDGYVSHCYNIGLLKAPLCHAISSSYRQDCYALYQEGINMKNIEAYFENNSGILISPNHKLPEGVTTLLEALNYKGEDDTSPVIWTIDPAKNDGYPTFVE